MIQNDTRKPGLARVSMTDKQERAAVLVAADLKTDQEIADAVGVTRVTISRWKLLPEFVEAMSASRDALAERARQYGIGNVEVRLASLNDRYKKLHRTVEARATDMTGECAGGETGLLGRQAKFAKVFMLPKDLQKGVIDGDVDPAELQTSDFVATKETVLVNEYAIDAGLLAELRALEVQAAKELGQWVDKAETKHSGGIAVRPTYDLSKLSDEQLEAYEIILRTCQVDKE